MELKESLPLNVIANQDERYPRIMDQCISLKSLFAREKMDEYHVDCLILYQIALGVLHIQEELSRRQICPGLYDLKDFYVDLKHGLQVYLTHPERFQSPGHQQEYEWYPEDERVFGGVDFFDEDIQRKADSRLLYKVLVASCRGNVKIPPAEIRADYSALFYRTLPPELKEFFGREEVIDYKEMRKLLREAIALEKESARMVRERNYESARRSLEESINRQADDGDSAAAGDGLPARPDQTSELYSLFVLLRTETRHSGRISRLLYQTQDRLEFETGLTRERSYQAFVYGDGSARVRDFRLYPGGFRVQCPQQIKEYSSGEAVMIACEVMEKTIDMVMENTREKAGSGTPGVNAVFRIYLITDGRLKNDQVFRCAADRLQRLKDRGCQIRFICDKGYGCEACDRLMELSQTGAEGIC